MNKILFKLNIYSQTFKTNNLLKISIKDDIYFYPKNNKNIKKYILNNKIKDIEKEYTFYTLIQYNKNNKKLTVYQDNYGDLQQLYYAYIKDTLILSTSIKDILIKLDDRNFCNKSLYYFLSCGFIPNKKTLIEGIYKIIPGKINVINTMTKNLKLKKKNNSNSNDNNLFEEEIYNRLLIDEINKQRNKTIQTSLTISSGYDSNYLIALFNKENKEEKKYYSVGGSKGIDETKDAQKILNNYPNQKLFKSYVNKKTFLSFPEIVYLYEGLFYERGIFLQYELYKMVEKENKNIILGDGADQVLHINYNNRYNMNKKIKKTNYSLYKNCPYEMLIYIVLKKNSIPLSNTNNNPIYPYLSQNFILYTNKIRKDNGFDKKIHKEIVLKTIPEKIIPYLNKIGGATDQIALFENDKDFLKWKNIALKSKYSSIKCQKNKTELSLDTDYILKIIYLILFEKIFLKTNKFILNKKLIKKYTITDFFK